MRQRLPAILLACLLALVSFGAFSRMPVAARIAANTCEVRVRVNGVEQWQAKPLSFCTFPTPAPTATSIPPTATATMSMPMPTETGTPAPTGWHAPTTHEHGDAPPAWVLTSPQLPFTQTRESHVGYKGVLTTMNNGVASYLITHVLASTTARSHGDHDYQLWVRDLSGGVSYWQGQLDFGSPPVLRTSDTGERPIILGERNPTDGCETWYSRPGAAVIDVGWTICDRYQDFAGTILGGVGAYRTADWVLYPDRLTNPAFGGHVAPTLARDCAVEFGVCRFTFRAFDRNFAVPGLVPIN